MSRRRAHHATPPVRHGTDELAPSAQVAWTYLGVLISLVIAGVLVALMNQTVAAVACPAASNDNDDLRAACKLSWAIWVAIVGFAITLLPALRLLKVGWRTWATLVGGAGLLVASDAAGGWWWWLAAALLPAGAALLMSSWQRPNWIRGGQVAVIVVVDLAAVVALIWWYLS